MNLLRHWGAMRGVERFVCLSLALVGANIAVNGQQPPQLTIHWDKTTVVENTTPTLQVVVNPPLRHGEALSIAAY